MELALAGAPDAEGAAQMRRQPPQLRPASRQADRSPMADNVADKVILLRAGDEEGDPADAAANSTGTVSATKGAIEVQRPALPGAGCQAFPYPIRA